jgi:hypothetical protein
MAIDPADMAELTRAVSAGIQAGFTAHYGSGASGGSGRAPTRAGSGGPASTSPPGSVTNPGVSVETAATETYASAVLAETAKSTAAAEQAFKATVDVHKIVLDSAYSESENRIAKMYSNLTRTYGSGVKKITNAAMKAGDFSMLTNEFAKTQLKTFKDLDNSFGAEENNVMKKYFAVDKAEMMSKLNPFFETLTTMNINAMKELSSTSDKMGEEVAMFSAGMGISMSDTAKLVNVSFAETGKASTGILTEITNYAKSIGDKVGMVPKDLADDTAKLVINMEKFTDIGVPAATRLAASLRNVGLSIPSFEGMISAFGSFEAAAGTSGDLSAMFGIQVDAIEMMYLANEDQEGFMTRMREELLSQGQDVENMSGVKQRALAKMMGMQVSEMKTFMNTGVHSIDMMGSSSEAAAKTQADALSVQKEAQQAIARTAEDIVALGKDERISNMAQSINQHAEAVAGYSIKMLSHLDDQTALGGALAAQADAMKTMANITIQSTMALEVEAAEKALKSVAPMLTAYEKKIAGTTKTTTTALATFIEKTSESLGDEGSMNKMVKEGLDELIAVVNRASPGVVNAYSKMFTDVQEVAIENVEIHSVPKMFGGQAMWDKAFAVVKETMEVGMSGIANAADNLNVPVEISAVVDDKINIDEMVTGAASITDSSNIQKSNLSENDISLESLKTAIIDAIKQGQAEIKHDLNVTLEIDKKKLAEVLMTAVTSNNSQFMTYTA